MVWIFACRQNDSRRRGLLFAIGVLLSVCSYAPRGFAQACCAGASAITPGRLELHEQALIGLELSVSGGLGSHDATGRFRASPDGAAEVLTQHGLLGAVRWLQRGQLSVHVPLVLAWRRTATTGAELGGGLGDINFGARYDWVRNREYSFLPGLGLLAGVTLPTGRAPEAARQPLGSDATGTGAAQFSAGLALERSFGRVLVNTTGLVSKRLRREVSGVSSELGLQWLGLLAVGYTIFEHAAAALVLTYAHEGDARVDERRVAGTASRNVRCALAVSSNLGDSWRLQAAAFVDPPIDAFGQNRLTSAGGSVSSILGFL